MKNIKHQWHSVFSAILHFYDWILCFPCTEPDAHGKLGYLNTIPLEKDWEWGIKHVLIPSFKMYSSPSLTTTSVSKQVSQLSFTNRRKETQRNNQEPEFLHLAGFKGLGNSLSLCVSAGNLTAVDTRSIKRLIFLVFCSWFQLWGLRTISQREAAGQRDGLGHL